MRSASSRHTRFLPIFQPMMQTIDTLQIPKDLLALARGHESEIKSVPDENGEPGWDFFCGPFKPANKSASLRVWLAAGDRQGAEDLKKLRATHSRYMELFEHMQQFWRLFAGGLNVGANISNMDARMRRWTQGGTHDWLVSFMFGGQPCLDLLICAQAEKGARLENLITVKGFRLHESLRDVSGHFEVLAQAQEPENSLTWQLRKMAVPQGERLFLHPNLLQLQASHQGAGQTPGLPEDFYPLDKTSNAVLDAAIKTNWILDCALLDHEWKLADSPYQDCELNYKVSRQRLTQGLIGLFGNKHFTEMTRSDRSKISLLCQAAGGALKTLGREMAQTMSDEIVDRLLERKAAIRLQEAGWPRLAASLWGMGMLTLQSSDRLDKYIRQEMVAQSTRSCGVDEGETKALGDTRERHYEMLNAWIEGLVIGSEDLACLDGPRDLQISESPVAHLPRLWIQNWCLHHTLCNWTRDNVLEQYFNVLEQYFFDKLAESSQGITVLDMYVFRDTPPSLLAGVHKAMWKGKAEGSFSRLLENIIETRQKNIAAKHVLNEAIQTVFPAKENGADAASAAAGECGKAPGIKRKGSGKTPRI